MLSIDIKELVSRLVTILAPAAPYLAKAAESAASKIGADLWAQVKQVYDRLHDRFKKKNDTTAQQTLDLFLKNPEVFEEAFAKILLSHLERSPELAAEMAQLIHGQGPEQFIEANESRLRRVRQYLSGTGSQYLRANKSDLDDVEQVIG